MRALVSRRRELGVIELELGQAKRDVETGLLGIQKHSREEGATKQDFK